jgi:molybdate transport system ATP-binding protein
MSLPPSNVDAARPILLRIDSATVVRPTGEVVFENLSWTIHEGESWAIVGPVGSGKTALTDLLLGRLRITRGSLDWPLVDRLRAGGQSISWPSEMIARVAFKEESPLFSYGKHYYQQRFNFIEPQDDLTLDEFLHAGMRASEADLVAVTARLGLSELRSLSFIKLSNGQTRRARIARALLSRPEILILDEPFVGLDADGRREVETILRQLVGEGVRLILITSPNSIPDCINHVLELTDRRVSFCGPRAEYRAPDSRPRAVPSPALLSREPVIELRHVNVTYAGKPILRDISWIVRNGERWAVLGPNGSGKTTLLSLICGDHPQAYGNDVSVFGRRRGTGESIWDVKRRIGLVSPEVHLYFTEPLTAARTVSTGFFDTLVPRPTTPEQDAAVRSILNYFGIDRLSDRPFPRLSAGEQRIVLLARALVKDPPLLILDEPFQMLDGHTVQRAQKWIDELPPDRTVLFVTHNEGELPRTVTRRFRLSDGAVVEMSD